MPVKVEPQSDVAEGVQPGTLTGLLEQIAHAPEAALGDRWDAWLRPGAVVGRFELVRELGRGGFGVVWEARDRELGRNVAFKAVRAGDRAALREERLVREAEAAARLSHPNIVTLHDVGRTEQGPYLVLELLRGQTLADRLDQGPLQAREALRVGVEIARGLAHAHAEGVVHRDLKPANVFLCDDDRVKLLDFGLAHALGRRRADGGTPAYMAPEQCKGAPEDERTDVFALGVMLFRMLSGELPFPEDGRALQSSRPAPALDVPELPALGALVGRMLAKDPVARPRDGAAVCAALTAFQRELERTPSSPSAPVRARRRPRARAALLAAAAAAALAALVAGAALLLRPGAPAASARAPVTVAVADFANQTGEPELDGLSGMLITSLEQSQRLQVLTRVRMLDLLRTLGKANVQVVDEALGRELALGAGVRALVLASIRRFDGLYAIELKVLDPESSEYLFTLKEEGRGKESVPRMIDRLSERTRERLDESPAEVRASSTPVADLTTSNLEAYQHYFRGEQLKEAIRYEPAVEAYRKAIAADPGFALAHYRIAYLGKFTGLDEAERRAAIDAALRHADRVPPKERLLMQAWKAIMDGRSADAYALYARAVDAHPEDKEVLFMAGDQYLHDDRWAEALPFMERAVALDPSFEPALMHLADCLWALGRTREMLDVTTRWAERAPSAAGLRALCMAELAEGRVEDAIASARRALAMDGSGYSRSYLAYALNQAGRYAEAEQLLRAFAAPTASRMDRLLSTEPLAIALAYQGRRAEALRVVDAFPEEAAGKPGARHAIKLDLLFGDGPTEAALREARALDGADPRVTRGLAVALASMGELDAAEARAKDVPPELRPHYEAIVRWKRGDPDGARRLLEPLAAPPAGIDERGAATYLLLEIAAQRGDDAAVIRAAEAFRALPSAGAWRSWAWPRTLYLAARAHERRGERGEARAKLDELLGAWKDADPGLPLVAEARALRRRLGGR